MSIYDATRWIDLGGRDPDLVMRLPLSRPMASINAMRERVRRANLI
jgi:hypothetical protein